MPELPEVETTRRGVLAHVTDQRVRRAVVRQRQLRWRLPKSLEQNIEGARIRTVARRAKYLLFETDRGTLIVHLGMSGSLRITELGAQPGPHDHVDLLLDDDKVLRFNDPRRFGSMHWTDANPLRHPLLHSLGPEPLSRKFSAEYLFQASRGRKVSIKAFIMNSHVVVGVGNIYASEALFRAGIRPGRRAKSLTRLQCERLCLATKKTLRAAIRKGGTTLRNFTREDGSPGYFRMQLAVYGRAGESCTVCGTSIKSRVQNQRATYYCPTCQT